LREDEALPEYVEHVLRSPAGRDYFTGRAQGTAGSMPKIDQTAVMEFPIALPPQREQQLIVRRVRQLFKVASTIDLRLQRAAARADQLPQAILSKAFSGELVPTEAELARADGREYETAKDLLARSMGAAPVSKKKRSNSADGLKKTA
jgi:type I restriction enzyme S subunit